MKKIIKLLLLSFLTIISSCKKEETPDPTNSIADYTIILYGCAGGNLDICIESELKMIEDYGYSKNVQFTALFKHSADIQDNENKDGVRQYSMTENGMINKKYADKDYQFNNPQNLAYFISNTKKQMPAKNYILIPYGHGRSFSILDQPIKDKYTKVTISDDNNKEFTTIFELEEGIRLAEGVDMIYWYSCNMNTIENNYQLKDCVKWVFGSAHSHFGPSNLRLLIKSLEHSSKIEVAMKEYLPSLLEWWLNSGVAFYPTDLTLSNLSHIDELALYVKEYKDRLCKRLNNIKPYSQEHLEFLHKNGSPDLQSHYYTEGGNLYYLLDHKNHPSVDLWFALIQISNSLSDAELIAITAKIQDVLQKMNIISLSHILSNIGINKISLGILWCSDDTYNYKHKGDNLRLKKLSELYPLTKFDQATGWSDFLKINTMKNVVFDTLTKEYKLK